ncbi:MAG TPA: hypothetical protein VMV69_20275 [Pirellulales bacterium]|nr:hypothetical protein [Pirellulales bacterium]
MLIYCDSVVLIYFLDTVGPFNVRAVARMAAAHAAGDVASFSDLTRLECRVKPLKLGATTTLADFQAFFLYLARRSSGSDHNGGVRPGHSHSCHQQFQVGRLAAFGGRGGGGLRPLLDER